MAAVLAADDGSSLVSAPLRRSRSRHNFMAVSLPYNASRPSMANTCRTSPKPSSSDSDLSSAPSSPLANPAESIQASSFTSTPATNLSISSECDDSSPIDGSDPDPFSLPLLSQHKLFLQPDIRHLDHLEPPPSPKTADSCTPSPADVDLSVALPPSPDVPESAEHAEDDSAIVSRPSRQVDYLSHDWKEEDIWSSWRYIVSKRGEYPNSRRLENASWRTWMKAKNNLQTISPEQLNWLKDCDVTWLYGPLQSSSGRLHSTQTEPSSVTLSNSNSFANLKKKPILKKRSMSEIMLQRSLTSASLLKQATAAVQAQETRSALRSRLGPLNADCYLTFPLSVRRLSHGNSSSLAASTDSSGVSSPYPERKHIHFNEQVEQCIAVDVKGDDEDDADTDRLAIDSDSDEGVMMKRIKSKKRAPLAKRCLRKTARAEGKIIAMLPSTKLKYREDTPDAAGALGKAGAGLDHSPLLSPSSSQETLRPFKPSSNFYFDDEDDYDEYDDAIPALGFSGWDYPANHEAQDALCHSSSTSSLGDEPAGMRRTPSGMFMPCDVGDNHAGDGILGRVIDTVNTARDIAHVIWNVGWRR